jgi:5-methylcytosine-specific restriction endonuclease McrA
LERAAGERAAEAVTRSRYTPAAKGGKWLRASLRWALYYRDDFTCVYCERVGGLGPRELTIDHVKSSRAGGRDHRPQNLVTACHGCNSSKQHLSNRQWFAKMRENGFDTDAVRRRIRRTVRRAVNRTVGRFLALC